MERNYKKLFGHLSSLEPKDELEHRILERITRSDRKKVLAKVWGFGAGSLTTFGLVLAMGNYLHSSFIESGFYEYLSLIFSGDLSFTFWKEIMLSVLESTPLLSVIGLMGAFVAFVWSTTNTLRPLRPNFNT